MIRELNKKKEEVLKVFRFLMTDKFSQRICTLKIAYKDKIEISRHPR